MFVCRCAIFRVLSWKQSHYTVVSQRSFSDVIHATALKTITPAPKSQSKGTQSLLPVTSLPPLQLSGVLTLPDTRSIISTDSHVDSHLPTTWRTTTYEELKRQNRHLVRNLSSSNYLRLLEDASDEKYGILLESILQDIMAMSEDQEETNALLLGRLLQICKFEVISPKLILSMFQLATSRSVKVPPIALERLIRLIANMRADNSPDAISLVELISPILHSCLRNYSVPLGVESVNYSPPTIIRTAFSFIRKLMASPFAYQQTVDLFHALTDHRFIPPDALTNPHITCSFNQIMLSALAKSSIHWGWRDLATKFLAETLQLQEAVDKDVISRLAVSIMYTLLESPTPKDLRFCSWVIIKLHQRFNPVPNGLVRQFYDSAATLKCTFEAEKLYIFTRTSDVLQKHHYPPPQSLALPWLMNHLASSSKKLHLTRSLATEVVRDNIHLPIHSCARFISLTASQGYATLARTLWERYASGKDKNVVVGNAGLLIRMTSLFMNRVRRYQSILEQDNGEESSTGQTEREASREQMEDMLSFVNHLMDEFTASHDPMTKVPHRILTSYARACFIVGRFAEGFDMFRHLLDRREVPDLYDVNVALTAVAESSPRLAARMIERMTSNGLQPDAVTFGTVMHHALVSRDMDLVDDMIKRVKELKNARLSLKTVASLVRASVTSNTKGDQRLRLKDALNIIESLTPSRFIGSPQTGKFLVSASLRADDPIIAYKFWEMLMRDSVEWGDCEHSRQRRLIAQLIRTHHQNGTLPSHCRYREMLGRLGQTAVIK